jgi:hypothetical protein
MESALTAPLGADDSCEGFADETAVPVVGRVSQGGGRAMNVIAIPFFFDCDQGHGPAVNGEARGARAIGLRADAQGSRA